MQNGSPLRASKIEQVDEVDKDKEFPSLGSLFQEEIHSTNLQALTNKQINVLDIPFSVCMT